MTIWSELSNEAMSRDGFETFAGSLAEVIGWAMVSESGKPTVFADSTTNFVTCRAGLKGNVES